MARELTVQRTVERAKKIRDADPDFAFKKLFRNYKDGASKRGLAFELSLVDFKYLVQQPCHYCGLPPSTNLKGVTKARLS